MMICRKGGGGGYYLFPMHNLATPFEVTMEALNLRFREFNVFNSTCSGSPRSRTGCCTLTGRCGNPMSCVSGLFAAPNSPSNRTCRFCAQCSTFNFRRRVGASRNDHDGLKANVQSETTASPARLLPSMYSQPLLAIPAIEFERDNMHVMLSVCELETICGNG